MTPNLTTNTKKLKMIDPQLVADAFKKTTTAVLPFPPPTSTSVAPIPTVIPDVPRFEKIGDVGHKTLWVIFVVMLLSTLTAGLLTWRIPTQKRLFHILTTFILAISAISYYAQATGSGSFFAHHVLTIPHKHHIPDTHEHVFRQVFWARYVDWALTSPLIVLNLAFLAGLDGSNILIALFADWAMVFTGWFFAYATKGGQRWGWYAMSCVAFLVVVHKLGVSGRRAVLNKDRTIVKIFAWIAGYEMIVWALYLVETAIGDGARRSTVDDEIIALAVIDILAKPIFGFWLLFAYAKYVPSLEGFWSHGLSSEGTLRLDEERA